MRRPVTIRYRRRVDRRTTSVRLSPQATLSLSDQQCSVLAVLVLATLWPDRFPGGWVDEKQASSCSVRLDKGGGTKTNQAAATDPSSSSRIAFYRARRRLLERRDLQLEHDRQRASIRFRSHPPNELIGWLFSTWHQWIDSAVWVTFISPVTPWDKWASSRESASFALADRGEAQQALDVISAAIRAVPTLSALAKHLQNRFDEASARSPNQQLPRMVRLHPPELKDAGPLQDRVVECLRGYDDRYLRLRLQLVRAELLAYGRDTALAERELTDLADVNLPPRHLADALGQARIWLLLAFCRYTLSRAPNPPVSHLIEECHVLLDRAALLETGLTPADRAEILRIRGLLQLDAARIPRIAIAERKRLLDGAEMLFRMSFSIAHSQRDLSASRLALRGLKSVQFSHTMHTNRLPEIDLSLEWLSAVWANTFGSEEQSWAQLDPDPIVSAILEAAIPRHMSSDEGLSLVAHTPIPEMWRTHDLFGGSSVDMPLELLEILISMDVRWMSEHWHRPESEPQTANKRSPDRRRRQGSTGYGASAVRAPRRTNNGRGRSPGS